MSPYLLPILYTIFVWWFGTGIVLYLNGLPRRTFKWTMAAATLLLVLALLGLYASAHSTRVGAAYLAFTCAILVWAWQEIAFLLGYVTGPRRSGCPPDAIGWRRTGYALQAVLHHELALIALAAAVATATWGSANQTGMWTFLVLWIMRQSAKLNIFLGARNLNESFLPAHLLYLQTYFRRRAMNPLFPVSVLLSSIVAWWIWQASGVEGITPFALTSLTFAAMLLSLAVLEHWFLVLPLPSEALWTWGLRSRVPPPPKPL